MREYLAQQVLEKAEREKGDKANIDQQAKMWCLDKQNYDEEEKRLKQRINKINKDNSSYLMSQMQAKSKAGGKMSGTEFALNRPLLREVNQRLKGFSQYDENSLKSGQNPDAIDA